MSAAGGDRREPPRGCRGAALAKQFEQSENMACYSPGGISTVASCCHGGVRGINVRWPELQELESGVLAKATRRGAEIVLATTATRRGRSLCWSGAARLGGDKGIFLGTIPWKGLERVITGAKAPPKRGAEARAGTEKSTAAQPGKRPVK